ncbi:MAG: MBOAT family protein [Clostridia bacterium]|nr:MBOAT family protein [Clostridia bacterium]
MLFNSLEFVIFLPIVFILYWTLPNKFRWTLLLIASYYFYLSWNVKYVVLILFTTAVSYSAGLLIEKAKTKKLKVIVLSCSIVLCLSVLFVFKYFNFFFDSVSKVLSLLSVRFHPVTLKLLLPVGISFYTFQTLSYIIDVFRGDVKAERHFGIYAAFVSFFPQLVAGPIERTANLLPQIKKEHQFNGEKTLFGMKLMLWGFFKKIVIADNISAYVDKVYGSVASYKGFSLVVATFLFAIQIYCDFSGYSDIARGSAGILDIDLMKNFHSPYFSTSIKEFWKRWHISLSTWFRDYIYIPLGGNRVKPIRRTFNLAVTFLLSGLWHGANWTFVIWGCVHGFAQIVENGLKIKTYKKNNFIWFLRVFIVFCLVTFAWVFFRAENISDAIYVIENSVIGISSPFKYLKDGFSNIGITIPILVYLIMLLLSPLAVIDYLGARADTDGIAVIDKGGKVMRWVFYITIGLLIVFFSQKGVAAEFVYFQF